MIKVNSCFSIISFIILLSSCGNCNWTAEERTRFEKECPKRNSFNDLAGEFRGFENKDFDSVLIKEYRGSDLLSSFKIKTDTFYTPWDKEHKSRKFRIERKMFTNYIYKFIIDSSNIFTLKKMNMQVWPRGPFCPDCTMGNYMIDSLIFEHNANPCFTKKGFKL